MKILLIIVFIVYFLCISFFLKGQMTKDDICNIYSQVVSELKDQNIKMHDERDLFVNNNIIIRDDFVKCLEGSNSLFENELEKNNIDYTKFINKTDKICLDSCFSKDISVKNESFYREKEKRFKRKSIGMCYLSNIAYYDNYAFVHVYVELSYHRTFGNYFFFIKDKNWILIYSRTEVD